MRTVASFVMVAMLASACAPRITVPTAAETAQADYGQYPTNYEAVVKESLYKSLIDPNSAMYDDWRVSKSYFYPRNSKLPTYAYLVCFQINAKNRMGGYTGWKSEGLFIRNGIAYDGFSSHAMGYSAGSQCAR